MTLLPPDLESALLKFEYPADSQYEYMRLRALKQIAKANVTNERIIRALLKAKQSDPNQQIQKLATEVLRQPIHQEFLKSNPLPRPQEKEGKKPSLAARLDEIEQKSPQELLKEQVLLLYEIKEALKNLERIQGHNEVKVADISMSFGSMVSFMLKWFFAAIPVGVIVWLCIAILSALLVGL